MSGNKREKRERVMHGIGVSPGVVVGPAYVLVAPEMRVVEREVSAGEVPGEIARLEEALIETRRQIKEIVRNLEQAAEVHNASILDAHLMVLDDRAFVEEIIREIRDRSRNVEAAVRDVSERYASVLASVEDDYLRERVADVRDVARRILRNVSGDVEPAVHAPGYRHVLVAQDLAPSDTAGLRKDKVLALATDMGSPTSHTAVMARALEIPAIVALHDVSEHAETGDEILIDGNKGVLIVHPSAEELENYGKVAEARRSIERELSSLRQERAETVDGHRIVLSANVEGPEEMDAVAHYGAEGVGLFRTEFLYLASNRFMNEDEQAEVYTQVASRLAPDPVIIRTLDLGGDKFPFDARLPGELNPFLGFRSIRLMLSHPEEFRGQLRAILRASAVGNVRIMYPLITRVEEVVQANALLEEAKRELRAAGTAFDPDIEVGVMIEVPSAALSADIIAGEVKFFSLGTNDLVQYTLAVDRVNERVANLYEPTHPAVLKLIRATVDAGHEKGIWAGLCGEMAANPLIAPLLVGLGVDELSVAPSAVPPVKDAIRSVTLAEARELAGEALASRSAGDVLTRCRQLIGRVAPEILELV